MRSSVRGGAMKASSDQVRIYHFWGPCRDAEVRIEIGDLLNPEKIRIRESWDEHERDYVIRLERNGKLILKTKYEETPWFFYSGKLIESRRSRGDVATAVDILRWFTRPIDGMLNELFPDLKIGE
jgi:hypothetical protein